MKQFLLHSFVIMGLSAFQASAVGTNSVNLITLEPGHFHASLVQKTVLPQVNPLVHVYSSGGSDLEEHMKRIEGFNSRTNNPTHWIEKIYTGPDFFEQMLKEKAGNVVVLAGNNAKKTDYIYRSVDAGFNVLSDKPMAITPEGFDLLQKAFQRAAEQKVLLYDIMTERHEITTTLQRELSRQPEVFGELQKGTLEDPAVTKISVHHFFKNVAGKPLTRPAWYFDVTQQGEGIVDVTSHLVDLVQWECFPEQALDWKRDVNVISARRWPTELSSAQFKQVTGLNNYPDFLKNDIQKDGSLKVYANGEINYTLRDVHAKVSVTWNFQAPEGTQDTHYSMLRGTRVNLIIKQGKEQNYRPVLYVENNTNTPDAQFEKSLRAGIQKLAAIYPGLSVVKTETSWQIVVPEKYNVGHEAHFGQVTEKFLGYLAQGKLPAWEVPNMISKYYTTTRAYELSHKTSK